MRKRRIWIGILAFFLVLALSAVALLMPFLLASDSYGEIPGLRKISVRQKLDGNTVITIRCFNLTGHTISPVDFDEKAYYGERALPINDDLGEFVTKVILHDVDTTKIFGDKFLPWTTYRLGENISFMYAHTPDHGIAVYVGSDEPISSNQIKIQQF